MGSGRHRMATMDCEENCHFYGQALEPAFLVDAPPAFFRRHHISKRVLLQMLLYSRFQCLAVDCYSSIGNGFDRLSKSLHITCNHIQQPCRHVVIVVFVVHML